MVYEIPSYTPAEAPTCTLSQPVVCPSDAVSIIPAGNLNSSTNWFACSTPTGYQLANQACAQTVINNDDFCINNTWDGTCTQDYHCCLGNFGCLIENACNYNPESCHNGDLCTFPGCNNPIACNYNAAAGCDDGSCILPDGCTDALACNYDPAALCEDGTCTYAQWWIPTVLEAGPMIASCDPITGYELADQSCAQTVLNGDPFCIENSWDVVCNRAYHCCLGNYSCHDASACNYDDTFCSDLNLCLYPGCTNPIACNYDAAAICDSGNCILPDGCTDIEACNYNATAMCDDGSCILPFVWVPNIVSSGPAIIGFHAAFRLLLPEPNLCTNHY